MQLHFLMSGAFEVRRAGVAIHDFRTHTARLLLAYLALEGDRPHEREYLAGMLWDDVSHDQALTNLRQTLHRLRQVFEHDQAAGTVLIITRQSVQLNPAVIEHIDVTHFRAAVAAVRQHHHRAASRCRVCIEQLQTALANFRGQLLAGLDSSQSPLFDEWLSHQRERVNADASFALQTLAAYHQRRGETDQAISCLRRWLALEPWNEEGHVWLMRVLDATGQRSAALRQFALCRSALARDLGIEPTEQTSQLAEQIRRDQRVTQTPPHQSPAVVYTLVDLATTLFPSSTFIGRAHDLQQLAERLSNPNHRLLTLVGPGGVGKTRLAIEAATAEAFAFEVGAIYVPLVGATRGEQIYDALAMAMRIPLNPRQAIADQVFEHLRTIELLAVLDNCEQIADANVVVSRLLAAAPKLTVLATSRTPLELRAEWLVPVGGLALAHEGIAPPAESYDAGRLFVALARRARGDTYNPSDAALIAECCRLLAGEPLALELVAFRLYQRSLAEILAELHRSLRDLATTTPDIPTRHQSMHAVFAWSWHLLSQPSQRQLARLSVFRDGFTLAAADAMLGDPALTTQALDLFVRQSLLQRGQHGRYVLHERVRQFAFMQLGDDAATAHTYHATFYLELVAEHASALYGRAAIAAERAIRIEIDNLRVAWDWALSAGRLDLVAPAMEGMMRFFQRTNAEEGAQIFAMAVEQARQSLVSSDTPAVREKVGKLLCYQAVFLLALTRPQEAHAAARAALALSEQASLVEAASHLYVGESLITMYDLSQAEPHLAQAAQIAHTWNDTITDGMSAQRLYTHAQRALGYIEYMRGNYHTALEYYQRCRDAYRAMKNPRYESNTLLYSAEAQRCLGNYGQAKAAYEQALELIRDTGNLDLENTLLNNLGDVLTHLGCYKQAELLLQEALALAKHLSNAAAQANVYEGLSRIARCLGDAVMAETYARQALSYPESRDHGWYLTALGKALEAQSRLDEAAEAYRQSVQWWQTWANIDPVLEAHAGLIRVALSRGAVHEAAPHAEEIYRRLGDERMLLEPLAVYLACWHAFTAAADSRAATVLQQAARLLAKQAARIEQPQLRASFLEQVAIHREIVAAAEQDQTTLSEQADAG